MDSKKSEVDANLVLAAHQHLLLAGHPEEVALQHAPQIAAVANYHLAYHRAVNSAAAALDLAARQVFVFAS